MHLTLFPEGLEDFRDDALAAKWEIIRNVRRVVTGALEVERAAKRIGSSLEASPLVYVSDKTIFDTLFDVDLAEVCITSNAMVTNEDAPADAFRLNDVPGRRRRGREGRRHQMRAVVEDPADRRRGPRISRCVAARRAGAARMEGAGSGGLTSHLRPGIIAAIVVLALDQASKLWLLLVFDIGHRGAVKLTPFFDLVLAWNAGISFGWFQNDSPIAQIVLMADQGRGGDRAGDLDGAVAHPDRHDRARPDHRRRHRQRHRPLRLWRGGRFRPVSRPDRGKTFNWYVFNLADVAIVAGVAALLYDSFLGVPAAKAP